MRAKVKLCFGTELQKGLGTFLELTGSIVCQVDSHNGIKSFSFLLFICVYYHEILLSIFILLEPQCLYGSVLICCGFNSWQNNSVDTHREHQGRHRG